MYAPLLSAVCWHLALKAPTTNSLMLSHCHGCCAKVFLRGDAKNEDANSGTVKLNKS